MTTSQAAPELRQTPTGWLALTSDDGYPRIGVVGATEDEAVERYETSRRSWIALLDNGMDTTP